MGQCTHEVSRGGKTRRCKAHCVSGRNKCLFHAKAKLGKFAGHDRKTYRKMRRRKK
jgi:hypothetical protein